MRAVAVRRWRPLRASGTASTVGSIGSAVALGLVLALTGCGVPAPSPTAPPRKTSGATPAPVPDVLPTLDPTGSAPANLDYFDYVNNRTITAARIPSAQQFVDGLAAAGFPRSQMQMTADKTTVNLTPGSIQFSVLINGGCLIGQFGQDVGGYHSTVAPVLSTGRCLIGDTAPIR